MHQTQKRHCTSTRPTSHDNTTNFHRQASPLFETNKKSIPISENITHPTNYPTTTEQPPHPKCAPSHPTSSPTAAAPTSPQALWTSAHPPPAQARNAPTQSESSCRSAQEPAACANKRKWRERRRKPQQRPRRELGEKTVSSMELLSRGE